MTAVTELTERIERLPEKRTLKEMSGLLSQFGTKVGEAQGHLAFCTTRLPCATPVFPTGFGPVEDGLSPVILQAQQMHRSLAADINAIRDAERRDGLARLVAGAAAVRGLFTRTWAGLMQSAVAADQGTAEIAEQLALPGHAEIRRSLTQLSAYAQEPPASAAQAATIQTLLTGLRRALDALPLQGEIGAFVQRLRLGTASPREVLQPDIREFLDQFNLWPRLRLSFQPATVGLRR